MFNGTRPRLFAGQITCLPDHPNPHPKYIKVISVDTGHAALTCCMNVRYMYDEFAARVQHWVYMQNRLTNSQRYLVNAKPGTNHSTNLDSTNPTTKYRCEFVNLFCIYAQYCTTALFLSAAVRLPVVHHCCSYYLQTGFPLVGVPDPRKLRRDAEFWHTLRESLPNWYSAL